MIGFLFLQKGVICSLAEITCLLYAFKGGFTYESIKNLTFIEYFTVRKTLEEIKEKEREYFST